MADGEPDGREYVMSQYCQIVIVSSDGERLVEPCSTIIGAEAYIEFYNSSRLRGESYAEIRELDLARFQSYAGCQLQ